MIEESGRGAMRLATYRSQEDRVRTKEGFEGGNYLRVFDGKSMLSRVRQCDKFITRFHHKKSVSEKPTCFNSWMETTRRVLTRSQNLCYN